MWIQLDLKEDHLWIRYWFLSTWELSAQLEMWVEVGIQIAWQGRSMLSTSPCCRMLKVAVGCVCGQWKMSRGEEEVGLLEPWSWRCDHFFSCTIILFLCIQHTVISCDLLWREHAIIGSSTIWKYWYLKFLNPKGNHFYFSPLSGFFSF